MTMQLEQKTRQYWLISLAWRQRKECHAFNMTTHNALNALNHMAMTVRADQTLCLRSDQLSQDIVAFDSYAQQQAQKKG